MWANATPSRLSALAAAVDGYCAAGCSSETGRVGSELKELRRLINLLELRFSRFAGVFAASFARNELESGSNPVGWLREQCHMSSHAAATAVNVGELEEQLPGSISAVAKGEIGMNHLSWMAHTAARLNNSPTATSAFDEDQLLKAAKKLSVQRFRRQCEHFVHKVDHQDFVRDQVYAVGTRKLNLTTYEDGSIAFDAILDPEGGAVVKAAIEPLAQRHGRDDFRDVRQRRADALVEICSHVMDEGAVPQTNGHRPHLHVTTTLETLLNCTGAAASELENGALISGVSIQRLACDGTMVRVLLDSESMVVDVGRAKRVVPVATRRALNIRDDGCVWPGCDRKASWTQAHHLIHWAEGGATDLANLVLLCRRHHWMVHEGGWSIARDSAGAIFTVATSPGTPAGRDPTMVA